MVEKKRCTRCGIEKELDCFSLTGTRPGLRRGRCRECDAHVRREKYDLCQCGNKKKHTANCCSKCWQVGVELDPESTRVCLHCKREKKLHEFGVAVRKGALKAKPVCMACSRIRVKAYLESIPPEERAARRARLNAKSKARMRTEPSYRLHRFQMSIVRMLKKVGVPNATEVASSYRLETPCAICGHVNPMKRKCVDHCHETGEFRGFLCNTCNAGLGQFGDSPRRLKSAIRYLREFHQR